jgi:L-malate glycosyltransferase
VRLGIVAHGGLGGSGTVAADIALGLARRGHEVHMVTPSRPFRLRGDEVRSHVVEATEHPMWHAPPWTLAMASRIAAIAAEARLELIHAHFAVPYAVATELACQLLGRDAPRWVATLHGTDVAPLGADPGYGPVTRFALRRAAGISVPSAELRAQARTHLGVDGVEVIANFVDGERFAPSAARSAPERELVLIHASNFRPVKRVGDVVEIFARVAARRPARLLLVGDGSERAGALAELAARGLSDRVEAPGARVDVERWLARAHIALVPSERESFGLAALEAQAAGVPVVGSCVGGLPEVVEHGAGGWLAPVGDVAAMAAHVLALAADPAAWQRAAERARTGALARFSPARALDAYEALYRDALHPTGKGPRWT